MRNLIVAAVAAIAQSVAFAAGHASLNVRDFGAVGDGVHDDTLAIQKAADALYPGGFKEGGYVRPVRVRHVKGISDGANGEVFFPKGVYRVTGPVVFEHSVNVRGEEGAVVRNISRGTPTFYFHFGYRVCIDKMAFEGGSVQVHQWAANSTDASMFVSRCRFSGASNSALVSQGFCRDIGGYRDNEGRRSLAPYDVVRERSGRVRLVDNYAGTKLAWFWNSTLINVERCVFEGNASAFRIASDVNVFRDCIVRAAADVPGPAAEATTGPHFDRVRFEISGGKPHPSRCALLASGGQTTLTGCSFALSGGIPAVVSAARAGDSIVGKTLRFIDAELSGGTGPLVRFVSDTFPNVLVVDGLKTRAAGGSTHRRLFAFERIPARVDFERWIRDGTKDRSSKLPPMAVERCIGVSLAEIDAAAFDATLPGVFASFMHDVPQGIRVRQPERVTYKFPSDGGAVFSDADMGAMSGAKRDGDDTDRLQALFDKAAKAGSAEIVLPAAWLCVTRPVTVRGKVAVRVQGRAVVEGPDDIPLFRLAPGSEALFENVIFNFGANAVSCNGKEGRAWFRNCCFYDQLGPSLTAGLKRGDGSQWRIEMVGGCIDTAHFFRGVAKPFFFSGVWLTLAPDRPTGCHRAAYACIENFQGGIVLAEDVCGVPRHFENSEVRVSTPGKVGDYRWVDNYGKYASWQFRYGGERRGITPVYNHPGASTYAEGAISYHKNNGHLRPGAASVAMSSEKDDVRFVDVMGFNFTEDPSSYMAVQGADGSYGERVLTGHVFNCYPFDVIRGVGKGK